VCWNCGVRSPGLPGWLRLVSNRFSWALAAFFVGAFVLFRSLSPTENEQFAPEGLENRGPVVTLKNKPVEENGIQIASPRSSGKLKVEIKREATAEKSRPEEKTAIEEEKHLAETFKGTNDDAASRDTWSVQVAAFRDESDAERLVDRLEEKGYETYIVFGERWHRVLVGEFVGVKEAGRVKDALVQEQRFSDAFLKHRAAQPAQ